MKVAREDIKPIGLSLVYEPNSPSDVNLEYDLSVQTGLKSPF